MAADDKISNATEKLGGKAEKAFGRATGDDEKVAEGQAHETKGSLKQAGENVKDAFR
ncbi:CsbD family protein [Amnibacterium sp. CER49]|uniref:CsbD family protein n=1 Tax=Amnibacterium sp. CER49 TaxID=3039161 RepID=UPI0024487E11|nr:CsbD family protein [Amnibacterium sp. CER49]MDH2443305.1 CsbD family protein [Amnibacterium sp. CER49]